MRCRGVSQRDAAGEGILMRSPLLILLLIHLLVFTARLVCGFLLFLLLLAVFIQFCLAYRVSFLPYSFWYSLAFIHRFSRGSLPRLVHAVTLFTAHSFIL